MLLTSSVDIHWVRDEDSAYSLRHAPSIAEWVNLRCGPPLTAAEQKLFDDLDGKDFQYRKHSLQSQKLTKSEKTVHDQLDEQRSEHSVCSEGVLASERERLAPVE